MDWDECTSNHLVKKVSPDNSLVNSLLKTSAKKLMSADRLKIDEITSESVISLYYDALRELLEALALKNGYKVYNHDCYCAFLKEILHKLLLSNKFDRFRKIRNSINYYGKEISVQDAKKLKSEIAGLIREIKLMLE